MTELGSPLKLDPNTLKRRKLSLILEKCVICQKSGRETVVSFTDHSKSRFFDAVDRRKDEIHANFISGFGSLNDIHTCQLYRFTRKSTEFFKSSTAYRFKKKKCKNIYRELFICRLFL
jgi:hypothetical protein